MYSIPHDRCKMLFDFYLLETSLNCPANNGKRVGANVYSVWNFENDDFLVNVKAIEDSLLSAIKEELLSALHFAIASEFRHAMSSAEEEYFEKSNSFKKPNTRGFYDKWISLSNHNSDVFSDDFIKDKWNRKQYDLRKDNGRGKSRFKAYYAANTLFLSPMSFISTAANAFKAIKMSKYYGGKPWINACSAWRSLKNAQGKDRYIWIDHVFDLQHNSGSLIDKLPTFASRCFFDSPFILREGYDLEKHDPYKWIQKALDFKQGITNPWELYPFASDIIRKICSRVLYKKGYGSATENNALTFYNAHVWKEGEYTIEDWYGGTFHDGIWNGKVWHNGTFYNGTWENGLWKGGRFLGGTWKNGTWEDGHFQGVGIWENGKWESGDFAGKTWQNGIFHGGSFRGLWKNGEFHNGLFTSYGSWQGGKFCGGTFYGSTFDKGEWLNGTFHGNMFEVDTWKDGHFRNGMFKGKVWEGGIFHVGIWKGGVWKGGTWKGGTWHNGTWEKGTWYSGTWKDGVWKGGVWDEGKWINGTWEGGTWQGGWIRDDKLESPYAKKDSGIRTKIAHGFTFVYSEVNPKEYWSFK